VVPVERTEPRQVLAPNYGCFFERMKKRYTQQEIELLKQNPNVKDVRENRLTLTFEFRLRVYETFKSGGSIRELLEENGIPYSVVGNQFIQTLRRIARRNGKPTNGCGAKVRMTANSSEEIEYLLSTGIFKKSRNGIVFTQEFINDIYNKYPDVDIVTELKTQGIDPDIVGYQRIHTLQNRLPGKQPLSQKENYSDEVISSLKDHPYVDHISNKQLKFKKAFYQRAHLLADIHINDILRAFEIDPEYLTLSARNNIWYKLKHWKSDDSIKPVVYGSIELQIKIERNLSALLEKQAEQNLINLREEYLDGDLFKKKALCQWIREFTGADPYHMFSVTRILKLVGISRSSYYAILDNFNYGKPKQKKEREDAEDIERIKRVIAYKGYPKGTRMVTMMLPRLEGVSMSRAKVQRLMRKAGLLCEVRKAKASRKASRELLERNRKPNIIKRRFRLYRPMECLLTDVSYLKHGMEETAYLSPVKDAVSGMILANEVDSTQNLAMTDKMLDELERNVFFKKSKYPAVFHSDQGALYLTDHFQKKIKDMGMEESMSRRGNCWDNASMESFFGHAKDEVDYEDCTLAEVSGKFYEYIEYYNYERPQWNRNKMTPYEYWKYLNRMSEEEYAEHLEKEKTKYLRMMEKSKEKALERAKDIGCVLPSNA